MTSLQSQHEIRHAVIDLYIYFKGRLDDRDKAMLLGNLRKIEQALMDEREKCLCGDSAKNQKKDY